MMDDPTDIVSAIGADWISPSGFKALYFNDPAAIWLEHHGPAHGLFPDQPEYALLGFRAKKGREFEAAWLERLAPEARQVCQEPWEGRDPQRVRETVALMRQGAPALVQPALWWPAERVYGVPDLIVRADWLAARLPGAAQPAGDAEQYVVLDFKFTSRLDQPDKRETRAYYEAQVRLYSYILGHIQGSMPAWAWLITRDRLEQPLAVAIRSRIGQPLDADLAEKRDRAVEIHLRGADLRPWRDEAVAPNYSSDNERWSTARAAIMERVPGSELQRLWYLGPAAASQLRAAGITCMDTLLAAEPDRLPARCLRRPKQMRAILEANRSGLPLRPPEAAPPARRHEFFVDFEFFSSFNVDFAREWPLLRGTPMIFMIGLGWIDRGVWRYRELIAAAERHDAERAILDAFLTLLLEQTGGALDDCALYHWHSAEPSQVRQAAERHALPADHPLRALPWVDLEQRCTEHACALPGAWSYSLKPFAQALARHNPAYDPEWPPGMSDGSTAQVLGWHAYACPDPLRSREMRILSAYLEADCRAVCQVLRWLRS